MKKLVLVVICMFLKTLLFAQDESAIPMETDRPDQTESPSLVPLGNFQVEIGFVSEYDENNDILSNEMVVFRNFLYPAALLKYGIFPWLEARFIAEYADNRAFKNKVQIDKQSGFNPVAVGAKIALLQEAGWQPKTSFISHVSIPGTSGDQFQLDAAVIDYRFTMQHSLPNDFSVSYNLGGEISTGTEVTPVWLYTFAIGAELTETISVFGESYGFYSKGNQAQNLLDAGITYKLFRTLQFDVSAGLAISDAAPDSFVGAGVSFRFPD